MGYRVYLFGRAAEIAAAENFAAGDDAEAAALAGDLYAATGDGFTGYEVWKGGTLLIDARGAARNSARLDFAAWTVQRQRQLFDLADRLADSFACVRECRELTATAAKLAAILTTSTTKGDE